MRAVIDCFPKALDLDTTGSGPITVMVREHADSAGLAAEGTTSFNLNRDATEDLVAVLSAYLRRRDAR